VPGAFVAALLADFRANSANIIGIFTALGHERRGQAANLGTLHVQTNTLNHHLYIIFLQAGRCTVVTVSSTGIAGFDTGLEFIEVHLASPINVGFGWQAQAPQNPIISRLSRFQ
jgi:hypothetical protein